MKLYKVVYTQNSEAFVQAENGDEAIEFITELTGNGGGDMSSVRINECGRSVEESLGELVDLTDEELKEDDYNTHKTDYGRFSAESYPHKSGNRLFWD